MNLTDFNFRIGLQHGEHAYMPLYSMMRQSDSATADDTSTQTCELLVYNLNTTNPESDAIILGTTVF